MAENANNDEKKGFVSTLKKYIDKGVEASKNGLKTAGNAISDFGDKSVIQIELSQLKAKLSKEYAVLGEAAYEQLSVTAGGVDPASEKISGSVAKVAALLKDIQKHEQQIKDIDKAAEAKKNEEKAKK